MTQARKPKANPAVSCMIGTMPAMVVVHKNSRPLVVGKRITFRDDMHGSKWEQAIVTEVFDDGYFKASRI